MKNIDKIITTLKKEVLKLDKTALTKVSEKRDPYQVLISCLISLRTKDAVTYAASKRLFAKAKTPKEMLKLSEKQIQKLIYPCGFYKRKSKTIKEISKTLIDKYNSKVPHKEEDLLSFKGVGRKTMNIVRTFGFKKEGIAVDVHVWRISNRLGLIKAKTPDETEHKLRKLLPKKYWIPYNSLLVTWGQNICKPVSPFCSKCALRKYCKRVGVTKSR